LEVQPPKKVITPLDLPLQYIIVEEPLENGPGPHLRHEVASSNPDECIVNQLIASPIQDRGYCPHRRLQPHCQHLRFARRRLGATRRTTVAYGGSGVVFFFTTNDGCGSP